MAYRDERFNGCATARCETLNTLTAFLEVGYTILLLLCVRTFSNYAHRLASMDKEQNVHALLPY